MAQRLAVRLGSAVQAVGADGLRASRPGYGLKDVTFHNVITEWHATNPAANVFEGTRREILRESHVVANLTHPMGAVEFNPGGSVFLPLVRR